ncbi:regulator of nonsense transcripts 3A-like [Chelonus insularis]|uniref:regulator of nonsense transcripts 3A-like n=1 Tax=Chelonus insularis TaxID=460826 RepID=UPI0015896C97|nr:regulator of nonsense transcripts 3A-like [Chelonus insularis]
MESLENKVNNENLNVLNTNNNSANNNNVPSMENVEVDLSKNKIDAKKEKCKPMTKVVIRRLPPTMTQSQFIEQVSPLPEHDYFHFVKADTSLGQNSFSRAYINFLEQQNIFMFREKFDNYVFVDSKGSEYPAVVEFAPFQRLPKKRIGRKKDPKCGTIESDHYYINFLESLKNQETDSSTSQPKTEYSYQPFDNSLKRVTTTPLLEYLKQRKVEKQRLKDEKREERRRRDLERRRVKDEPTISKVLKNSDSEREVNRENKENKDEKDKMSLKEIKNRKRDDQKCRDKIVVSRDRDSKGIPKGYRDREDKKYERDNKNGNLKKHDEKKLYSKQRDEKDGYSRDDKKYDGKNYFKDRKEFKEDSSLQKEKTTDEKKGKSYEKMRQEKKRMVELKKGEIEENINTTQSTEIENSKSDTKNYVCNVNVLPIKSSQTQHDDTQNTDDTKQTHNSNKLQQNTDVNVVANQIDSTEVLLNKLKINEENSSKDNATLLKQNIKISKRRSSLESGSGGEGSVTDSTHLRRHKSLDGENEDNLQKNESDEKDKDKKDPRLERRIRNKDRPAMEIYRPGMGKFSKQRLEREKSTHDDRASLSQSPTPLAKGGPVKISENPSTSSTSTELRSMTFKRTVSRDIS